MASTNNPDSRKSYHQGGRMAEDNLLVCIKANEVVFRAPYSLPKEPVLF